MSLRGANHCETVLALRRSGKSLSTELCILLASWHVTLRRLRLGLDLRLRLKLKSRVQVRVRLGSAF